MPAWMLGLSSVRSRIATAMTSTAGRNTLPATVIQCGWSFSTRFSPGRSLLMAAYCPLLGQLEKNQDRPRSEVGPVGNRALERAVSDDERDRSNRRQQDPIEERRQRVRPAEQETHEERELDVSEPERLGLEDRRSEECEHQKQQPGAQAHEDRVDEWPPQDDAVGEEGAALLPGPAHHRETKCQRHRRKDHAV